MSINGFPDLSSIQMKEQNMQILSSEVSFPLERGQDNELKIAKSDKANVKICIASQCPPSFVPYYKRPLLTVHSEMAT